MKSAIKILVFAAALSPLLGQQDDASERNRRLFTTETFGGNGRTCDTCHSLTARTGTVSPEDAQERYRRNPRDPLFLFDGSDDGQGNGVTRMLQDATILITLPLPPNITLEDNPSARTVTLRRGTPTTRNTPALDPVLMLDGREPTTPPPFPCSLTATAGLGLCSQALHAIQTHDQPTIVPTLADLLGISQFEMTEPFFSSPTLRAYALGGPPPVLPQGTTESEIRGRTFFVEPDTPFSPADKAGSCALCHSGPLLNQTNKSFVLATKGLVPAGTRFQSVAVSELNEIGNPVQRFLLHNTDGTTTPLCSPDPGRALITGNIPAIPLPCSALGPPFSDWNAFKIPILWGVKDTAPYFHDNSARTLEDVAAHYAKFFQLIPAKLTLTLQDQADIVAYLKLLN
jgi:cytochrome c peroxidase